MNNLNFELIGSFINRAGVAFCTYAPDKHGYHQIRIPEFLGESVPYQIREYVVGSIRGKADADVVVRELNRYIRANKRLLNVPDQNTYNP